MKIVSKSTCLSLGLIALLGASAQLVGCGTSTTTNPTPFSTPTPTPAPVTSTFLFVGNSVNKTDPVNDIVTQFSILDGALSTPNNTKPLTENGTNNLLADAATNAALVPDANTFFFNPANNLLYAFSITGDSTEVFSVDPSTANLTPVNLAFQQANTFTQVNNAEGGSLDATGSDMFVYSNHSGNADTDPAGFMAFTVNQDGTLTAANETPTVGSTPDIPNAVQPQVGGVAIGNPTSMFSTTSPDGHDVLIITTNDTSNNVQTYLVTNPGGVVSNVPTSTATVPNTSPNATAAAFSNGVLYVAGNGASNNVTNFTIGNGGVLVPVASSAQTVTGPTSISVATPTGGAQQFALVTTSAVVNNVVPVPITAGTNVLGAPLSTATTATAEGTTSSSVDPSGNFLFVTNAATVTSFSVGTTGVLSQLGQAQTTGDSHAFGALSISITH